MTTGKMEWHYANGRLTLKSGEAMAEIDGEFAEFAVNKISQLAGLDNVQLFLTGLFICAAAAEGGLVSFRGHFANCRVLFQLERLEPRHG